MRTSGKPLRCGVVAAGGGRRPVRGPCRLASRRRCAGNSASEGLKVSAWKSPIRTSLCSWRYSAMEAIRSWRRCSGWRSRRLCGDAAWRPGRIRCGPSASGRNDCSGRGRRCFHREPLQLLLPASFRSLARAYFGAVGETRTRSRQSRSVRSGIGAGRGVGSASACAGRNILRHWRAAGTRCGWIAGQWGRRAPVRCTMRASSKPASALSFAVPGKLYVGDHAEADSRGTPATKLGGIFVVRSQQNLGTGPHAHQFVRYVHAFAG